MTAKNTIPHYSPRQEFLSSMKDLSDQFVAAKQNLQTRESALMRALDHLTNSLEQKFCDIKNDRLAQKSPLVQAACDADEKITARLALWRTRIEKYNSNTEFREDFGDSLLVYVYGKVKAGKSSLGNYVAYGHGDPDSNTIRIAQENGLKLNYFMRDATNNSTIEKKKNDLHSRRKFSVGSMETTTEIQGFHLPGLTWIDSPGLHSVTPANGDLSKRYADAADLILYPMNSGQPGRASDLAEISGLLHARKAFVVVITRCDEIDVDIDDQGIEIKKRLMKAPKDRQDQINYVRSEIIAKAEEVSRDLLDADVITISVSYAEEHGDDLTRLHESGMTDLFQKLTALTQTQGVALKRNTPLNNLRTFVDLVIDGELSVKGLHADLLLVKKSIASQRDSLAQKQQAATGRVMLELGPAIEQEVIRYRTNRDITALSQACSEIVQEIVIRHTAEVLAEVISDTQASINTAIRFDEFKEIPEFCDLTEKITLPNNDKGRAAGGALGALIAGIGVALAIPTGGASLLVTAVGTAAATAGTWIGAKAGEALVDDTIITVSIGDNTKEVIAETERIATKIAQKAVAAAFKKLDEDFFISVEVRSHDIAVALEVFETTLKKEVFPNEI